MPVDWEKALQAVSDDDEFLQEILDDFIAECNCALDEMEVAFKDSNFTVIMQSAHKIKGSSSYLCFTDLMTVSANMQDTARTGTTGGGSPELLHRLNDMFTAFKSNIASIKTAITVRYPHKSYK